MREPRTAEGAKQRQELESVHRVGDIGTRQRVHAEADDHEQRGAQRLDLDVVRHVHGDADHEDLADHNDDFPVIKLRLVALEQKVVAVHDVFVHAVEGLRELVAVVVQSLQHIERQSEHVKDAHRHCAA